MDPSRIHSRVSFPLSAIFGGGLVSGALDITAAILVYGYFGVKPVPLLQSVAAGAIGPRSFHGGLATAALGLFFQFLIATIWTAIYVIASRSISFLISNAPLAGALYGIFVYFLMRRVVIPI
jgi:hypothetical protein